MRRCQMSTLRKFSMAIIFVALALNSNYQTSRASPATTWYVEPTGTDYNQCGAYASNPCKTIQYVLSTWCYGGCSISLAAGTYSPASNGEVFPIVASAATNQAIYITGRKGLTQTFIDASGSGQNVINVSAGIGFSLSGVTVKGGNTGIQLSGGPGYNGIGADIHDNDISYNVIGIFALYTQGTITLNNIHHNTNYGIYEDHATGTISRNAFFFNCTGGVNSYDAAIYLNYFNDSGSEIVNNLIGWNNGSGIYISGNFSGSPVIINNTIWFNYGGSGIAAFNLNTALVANNIVTWNGYIGIHANILDSSGNNYNDVWANGYADYLGTSPGTGSISKDPRLVSIIDPHLQCNSPAINAGENITSEDYDGNPRPVDGTVDMGAYEKQLPICVLYLPLILK
jgi:hypothetical protein